MLSIFTALLLAGCNLSLAADVTPPPGYRPPPSKAAATVGPVYPLTPPNPQNGAVIYVEKCAPCHGVNGLGDGPQAPNLPNQPAALGAPEVGRQAVPAEWFRVVTQGNLDRFMPPFPSLNDKERWDVTAYALSLSASSEMIRQGGQVYAEVCAACHGLSGKGDGPDAPPSTPDFTDQVAMTAKSANVLFQVVSQGAAEMPAFGDKLSEEQRWAAVYYARSLSFASEASNLPSAAVTALPSAVTALPAPLTATLTTTVPVTGSLLSSIRGVVTDASGGIPSAGAEVNLHGFDGMQLAMTATATLSGDGSFVFDQVEIPAGRAFLVTTEYDNVLYGSDVAQAQVDGEPLSLNIQVYPSTTDQTGLSVDRLHFFFELVNQDTLRVAELYIISNNTGKTIVGQAPGEPVLRFSLPQGAQNLQFQEGQLGERYIEVGEGFADTSPVRPAAAAYQVLYSYELPYTRKLKLTRPIQWNTDAIVVLAPATGLSIQGDGLQDAGARDIQGAAYHTYNGPAMPAGSTLTMTVTGKLSGNLLQTGSSTNLLVGGGALGLVLIAAGAWLWLRKRPSEDADAPEQMELSTAAPGQRPESAEAVMDAILALDDLYQEGQLPDDAYQARRAELKARLAELKEQ